MEFEKAFFKFELDTANIEDLKDSHNKEKAFDKQKIFEQRCKHS